MKPRPLLIAAALVLLVGAAVVVWQARPVAIPAVEVRSAPLVRTVQFSGRVATTARVDIGATITGRVASVAVAEGAAVRRGDVLLELETAELGAAVAQAVAGERQAAARLAGLQATGRATAAAAVAQAESVLVAARAELRRTEELIATGFVSPARLDEARRAVAVAEAQLAGARAQAQAVAENGSEIDQARAQLAVARSARSAAEARLAQSRITAPTDARVLSRAVEPGQIVQPGRALMSLALDAPVQLVAPVDERFLEQLRVGQPAAVLADAYPSRRFAARVASIAPRIDAQRGAVEVKLDLDGPAPDFLREDMTLSIEVETARAEAARVVPLRALRAAGSAGRVRVQVVRDGRVADLDVTLGLRTERVAQVLDGVAEGDVVIAGTEPLSPGTRVRPELMTLDQLLAPGAGAGQPGSAGGAITRAMGR
ncbi:MAG: efflux RND transporter periplasmic adaptor subunit [Ideonella sp.]|nr:efflux RND transporter periplasmic adaptor subunit [Ideonella sp.]